jgi:hypothetical protein
MDGALARELADVGIDAVGEVEGTASRPAQPAAGKPLKPVSRVSCA